MAAHETPLLEVRDVHAYYGLSYILRGVSLRIKEGSTVALLGRNGAGKTTTIRTITGLLRPRGGTITFAGEDITGLRPDAIARKGIACVPEGRDIFSDLSVQQNLEIARRQNSRWTLERIYDLFPIIPRIRNRRGSQLSGGEQQIVAIARSLLLDPRLLLLDEPTEGLAPAIVKDLYRILRLLRDEGVSCLIVEQKLDLALALSDCVYVLDQGQVVFSGEAEDLRQNPDVIHRHLGVGA